MSVSLILTILTLLLQDGPSIYGGVLSAIHAIEDLQAKHGSNISLGMIDSVLREYNIDVQAIQKTYGYRPEGNSPAQV